MELPAELKGKTGDQIEEWFLTELDREGQDPARLIDVLVRLAGSGDTQRAETLGQLLQDSLAAVQNLDAGLTLLGMRSEWRQGDPEFRGECKSAALRLVKGRLSAAFVKNAGFDSDLALGESLRRFRVLSELKPGVFCQDKTWGFGVVQRLDDFYEKIWVDFRGKPAHPMSLAYAAEVLRVLAPDHLLVRNHTDPTGMAEMAKSRPGDLVRLALRSYGPLTVAQLKDALVGSIVAEEGWREFWDAARASLKADPAVDIPAKRSEPIRLLPEGTKYGEGWFSALRDERDPDAIVGRIESWLEEAFAGSLSEERRGILVERLEFALHAARGARPDLVARIALAAQRAGMGEGPGPLNRGPLMEELLQGDGLLGVVTGLPARHLNRVLDFAREHDAAHTFERLAGLLPRMPLAALSAAVEMLASHGRERDCAEQFRARLESRASDIVILYWLCRNLDRLSAWQITSTADLLTQVVEALENPCGGETLRVQNQLRRLWDQKEWLESVLIPLTPQERAALFQKVQHSRGWDESGRRLVMVRMIRICPELQSLVAEKDEDPRKTAKPTRVTSWRSYRQRQQDYKKLVERDIPANSRDIAVARSYGDLSENHEYKTAKEMQGILLKRKGEMELDLEQVQGTDFTGMAADRAGMGTCVVVRRPDGTTSRFCILGEWDSDANLGIVSSGSKVGQGLTGKKAGDQARVPGAAGDETCSVAEVTTLPAEVQEWIVAREEQERGP